MAELTEIPLELQLKEANRRIKLHVSKGWKYQQFLSPMFLRCFPAIMENQISVDWNIITGIYDRMPTLPITLIDTEILDPSVWEVPANQQHVRRVLAMVQYTLPVQHMGQPAIVFGASFVFIPGFQARTTLRDTLTFLKKAKEDCLILVAMPGKPTFSPQPRKGRYLTVVPICGDPDIDRGPLQAFAAALLPVASKEGWGGEMPVRIKMPSCFGSSKRPKTELMWEPALQRGPLWKNVHYVECNNNGELVLGNTGKPLCQELLVHLTGPLGKLEYTPTDRGHPAPLTLAASHPGWDDYFDLTESVNDMAYRLMKEDGQDVATPSKASTTPKKKEAVKNVVALVNDGINWIPAGQFPSDQRPGASRENPVHLSDATDASASCSRPKKDDDFGDEAKLLGHYSEALRKMAASIVGLEDGYFKALHEVIMETERALWDVSCIDAHYVSQVVTVMSSWQEVVQAAASHMQGVDTTTYLAHHEDARRVTREYMAAVVKAREEHDAAHVVEEEAQKQALKDDDYGDPVVRLLQVTRTAAHAQCEKAVDAFLASIKKTLRQHLPVHAQGPLILNALSTAFQFQMSVWHMIGEECVRPVRAKHSDWCGLVGIVQAIIETFSKNCALMFPAVPPPPIGSSSFSATFRLQSSDDNDDDDNIDRDDAENVGTDPGFRRFNTSLSAPARGDFGGSSRIHTSTPLPRGGVFRLSTDPKDPPSSSLGAPPDYDEERSSQLDNDNLDLGKEADDEEDGEKDTATDEILPDTSEMELLLDIIDPTTHHPPSAAPKSGDKRGPSHLDGGSISSDSSVEDLDAKNARPKKKGSTPTKASASGSHPSQWTEEDIDVVHQTRYKVDLQRFENYRINKIDPGDINSINTKDHSAYIEVARVDPGSVIRKSVFSVVAYHAVLKKKGGDIARFDKDVDAMFKKGPQGSRAPNTDKVAIDRVMLVCQRENGVNVKYSDSDGFGRPGMMGLWDLHSSDALSWAKMQLPSGTVDANFCPLCSFWSTNNETLNNHVRKHYKMGLTCRADGFTMASMAAMKAHMESEHGYEGKCAGAVKKPKGKG